ncbi:S-type pyocin/colicin family protein [Pseudomonas alkylphenolica]|uniref:S-type pyocin/colicin family protein n=2 Tax=Pseudomonas alkylphenolica TaxID=237609 RepID=A0A077FBQ6_9PSED|nr:S-type pyocin/colicin family protein [Pseudomonas alkylphenolica]
MLGIPALEGVTLKPAVWVYPPGPKTEQILINPAYPPDYQDAIIWFPSLPQVAPIYLSINVRGGGDIKYHKPPKSLLLFQTLNRQKIKAPSKEVAVSGDAGKTAKGASTNGTASTEKSKFIVRKEPHTLANLTLKQVNKPNLPNREEQPRNKRNIIMFLWISGFLPGDNEDDSLKYELDVAHEFEQRVLDILGWSDLESSPDGDWLLNAVQVQQIASIVGEPLPADLDLFIGVTV